MRTTLTINDDLAAEINRLRKKEDRSLKDVVNDLLWEGVRAKRAPAKKPKPFRTKAFPMGRPLIGNIDNVAEVLAYLEGEDHK